MAYTAINVQKATAAGTTITLSNGVAGGAGTGYKFSNDGNTVLHIRNTSGSNTPSVVVVTGGSVGGNAIADVTRQIAVSATVHMGPFPKEIYDQQGSDEGFVYVYFSGGNETDLRVAAVQ